MVKVLVPLAEGFEEIEAVTIIDILRRAGIQVDVAGLSSGPKQGARKIVVVPDMTLEETLKNKYDAIVLPGGIPGVDYLRHDKRVVEAVKKMKDEKKVIGAICAAPLVLKEAGIAQGIKVTSYPGLEKELAMFSYEQKNVVIDDNLITSRGVGTALEFSLMLVELLVGKEKAQEVKKAVLA